MKRLLISLTSMLMVFAVQAQDITVYAPMTSTHFNNHSDYNDRNYGLGLGIRWTDGKWDQGAQIGQYKNSFYTNSHYVAYDAGYNFNPYVRAGILLGAVDGYSGRNSGGFAPLVAPQLSIMIAPNVSLVTTYIQSTTKHGSSALGYSLAYKF